MQLTCRYCAARFGTTRNRKFCYDCLPSYGDMDKVEYMRRYNALYALAGDHPQWKSVTPEWLEPCSHPHHAPLTAYRFGCRCARCRKANGTYQKQWKKEQKARPYGPPSPVHCERCDVVMFGTRKFCEKCYPRAQRLRMFNLTFADYDALLASQGGVCASCGTPPKDGPYGALAVDHDHACCDYDGSCGHCVRGLLCARCNTLAAVLEDHRLPQVRVYIERTRQARLFVAS